MATGASPSAVRRRWAVGLVLSIAAVLIRLVLLARNGDSAAQAWTGIVLAVGLAGLVLWLTMVVYNHGESRLRAHAGSDAWVHRCIDPDNPRAWRSVVVSDDAVAVLSRRNRILTRWPVQTITDVAVGPVRIGLLDHTGLTISLGDGSTVRMALPSRSTLSYPRELADQARSEILRRMARARS